MGSVKLSCAFIAIGAAVLLGSGVDAAENHCAFATIDILHQAQPSSSAIGAASPSDGSIPQSFSLTDATITLEDGANDGCAQMVLVGEAKASPAALTVKDIVDLGLPSPPQVTVKLRAIPRDNGSSATSQVWLIAASVEGLPANTKQSRQLAVSSGGKTFVLPYTLTNKSTETFSWTVRPPPAEIQVAPGATSLPVVVAVGPVRATEVRITNATLLEKSRKTSFDESGMRLCKDRDPKPCNDEGLTLAANGVYQLWLRPTGSTQDAGQFSGQPTLVSAQKPDGSLFPLTLGVSSDWAQPVGSLLIFFGVVVSFFVTRYSRNLLNRDQLLLPARLIAEDFERLNSELQKDWTDEEKQRISETPQRIQDELKNVSSESLEGRQFVPSVWPVPWSATASNTEQYRQWLQKSADWATALRIIVQQGLEEARRLSKLRPAPPLNAYLQSLDQLDKLARPADGEKPGGDLQKKIDDLLEPLKPAVPREAGERGAQAPAPSGAREPTSSRLIIQITQISWLTWALMIIVTVVLGWNVLIRPNLGFGLPEDFVLCFLWGLGLPLGAQQVVQSSNAATALGIAVPTTSP